MGLETGDTIEDLVSSNPTSADPANQGDNHLRLLKVVMKNIFPGGAGQGFAIPITSSEAELNSLVGINDNVQDLLDAETAARILADGDESAARVLADDALGLRIDGEETARIAADGVLQTNINNLTTDTGNAFDAVEVTTDALQVSVNSLDARVTVLENEDIIPAGTRMLFSQASAPTGWTQDVAQNDRMLRVVSGAGGGVGGSDSPIALSQNIDHTHTTSGHALTLAQMPSHSHNTTVANQTTEGTNASGGGSNQPATGGSTIGSTSQGSGSSHTHGNTGSAGGTVSFAPRYQDIIVASKNA